VVIGPNGSGKTTLLSIAGARLHPSAGTVEILGERLGASDWRAVRARVGFVSGAVVRSLRPDLVARDIVMTGRYGALEPWWHAYDDADRARATALLAAAGVGALADRPFRVISEGERQQVLLARVLMADPGLLLLDEPFAGLDLGARERLLARLGALAGDPATPPLVLVTHHVEEIPPGTTHALVLGDGRVVAAGAVDDALTAASLSDAFALPVDLTRDGDRWSARARPRP
jgi:iron complex transport system ATP-binding protein